MPEAWKRVQAEKRAEIAGLVKDGTLQGQGRGKALKVQAGSFYDWLGENGACGARVGQCLRREAGRRG